MTITQTVSISSVIGSVVIAATSSRVAINILIRVCADFAIAITVAAGCPIIVTITRDARGVLIAITIASSSVQRQRHCS